MWKSKVCILELTRTTRSSKCNVQYGAGAEVSSCLWTTKHQQGRGFLIKLKH